MAHWLSLNLSDRHQKFKDSFKNGSAIWQWLKKTLYGTLLALLNVLVVTWTFYAKDTFLYHQVLQTSQIDGYLPHIKAYRPASV